MPARKRAAEARRRARAPRVVPGWQYELVGRRLQEDSAWLERTCMTCNSPHCTSNHDAP